MARIQNTNKPRKHKLDPLREFLKPLVEKANALFKKVREMGKGATTIGYQDALASLTPKQRAAVERGEREIFSIEGEEGKRYRTIKREADRLNAFLTSDSATEADIEYAQRQANARYERAFAESNFHDPATIDPRLDEDIAKVAWEVYRRIEETGGAALLFHGDGGYDSNSMINLIYATLVDYGESVGGNVDSIEARAEAIDKARNALEEHRKKMDFEGHGNYISGDYDYGFLRDVAEADSFEKLKW